MGGRKNKREVHVEVFLQFELVTVRRVVVRVRATCARNCVCRLCAVRVLAASVRV